MAQAVEDVIWNLADLYNGPEDPAIRADTDWCRQRAAAFSRYRGRIESLEAKEFLDSVAELEELNERAQKLLAFAYLNFATRTQDPGASALFQSVKELGSELYRDTLFFNLEWTKLEGAEERVSNPCLAKYRHYLLALRRYRPYVLSEPEERILAEKEPAGASAWAALFDKVLSGLRFGEKKRTETEVLSDLYSTDREVRKNSAVELTEGLRSALPVLTHLFNTVLLDKSIEDRLRKYPNWLSARNLSNEAEDAMVEALVSSVCSRYDLVARYYRLKRDLLGHDRLADYDRYAPIPGLPDTRYSWEEAKSIVLSAFGAFSPGMAEIASEFFERGWIHAPVLPGKRGGAFAHPTVPSAHPYVLVNFQGRQRDIMTLAHELGHGVHQYLARAQGLFNSDTPLTTAESASVFGEMLVFRHLLARMNSPAERRAFLCSKIEDTFATVFRQVSMNRFEDAVHNGRRTGGELDAEFISSAWLDTQKAMFGDSVYLTDNYRIWWSYIPHFVHSPGYVYAYAFGELLVLALYAKYLSQGADFVPMYSRFLASGGNAGPNDLLRPFGIDLEDPDFWNRGINIIEGLIEEAEGEMGR
ncbi:MAG: M3 family oligoendopeptidase [Desulfobacteraceae bacterium]|nr:M3 family oligoendopeptidase [Desulfobacteraceae bacterium]